MDDTVKKDFLKKEEIIEEEKNYTPKEIVTVSYTHLTLPTKA